MIDFFRKKLSFLDIHTKEVLKKSSSSTIVKVGGIFLGLGVSIFLGRVLGADGVGVINLTARIVGLLIILSLAGFGKALIKEVAIAYSGKNWQRANDVMYTAYIINSSISIVISTLGIIFSPWISKNIFNEPRLTVPLIIGLSVMTPQVLSRIFSSGLAGYRKIWQSSLVDRTLSTFITGLLLLCLYILKQEITINKVAILYAIGRVFVTISMGVYWNKLNPFKRRKEFLAKTLLRTSLPLLLTTLSLAIANMADSIMLGWLRDSRDVGLYTVAARVALMTSFFLQISNAAISPKIAALYAEGKIAEMSKMVKSVTKGLSFIGIFPVIIFIFFGKYILSIWGAEFVDAFWVLIILSFGQFFSIATGATGLILVMCGFEKIQGRIAFSFLIINLILNYFFIVNYGAIGAAIATAISLAGNNIVKLIFVKLKVGILTIPFVK